MHLLFGAFFLHVFLGVSGEHLEKDVVLFIGHVFRRRIDDLALALVQRFLETIIRAIAELGIKLSLPGASLLMISIPLH